MTSSEAAEARCSDKTSLLPLGHIVARIRSEISGPSATPPSAPPTVPGYTIGARLGEGGMGAVYQAEDRFLKRRVAVKVISTGGAHGREVRRLFLREARAMAAVAHPNVVHIYGYGESARGPYIVMQYVEGDSLSRRLREGGPLPSAEALDILEQCIDGLEAVWERGIVHRDVKPSNILLDAAGRALLCDFGLAGPVPTAVAGGPRGKRGRGAKPSRGVAATGGTPQYMSPEQAHRKPTDLRSDIYSLGLVLGEMLTGVSPVSRRDPADVLLHQVEGSIAALREHGIDAEVIELVAWMTRTRPADRPASYAALRSRVEEIRHR